MIEWCFSPRWWFELCAAATEETDGCQPHTTAADLYLMSTGSTREQRAERSKHLVLKNLQVFLVTAECRRFGVRG